MHVLSTARKGDVVLKIYQDNCAEDPREWDNLGTMVCAHGHYSLGDEQAQNIDDYRSWNDWFYHEIVMPNGGWHNIIYKPLYMYDHSGITIRTRPFSCPWDSGQIGYIYVTKKQVREEWKRKRVSKHLLTAVLDILECEVEIYDQWGRNDVYYFSLDKEIKCSCCGHVSMENIDSCGGFYGTDWLDNGMSEQIDKEYHSLLEELETCYA